MTKSKYTIISSWIYCHSPSTVSLKQNPTSDILQVLYEYYLSVCLSVSLVNLLLLICSRILSWISNFVFSFHTLAIPGPHHSYLNNSYSLLVGFFTYIFLETNQNKSFFSPRSLLLLLLP